MPKQNPYKIKFDARQRPYFVKNPTVELKDVPETGEEHILRVIFERLQEGNIHRSNLDFSHLAVNQTVSIEEEPVIQTPESLIPSLEWVEGQIIDFVQVQEMLSLAREHFPGAIEHLRYPPFCVREWRWLMRARAEPDLSLILGLQSVPVARGLALILEDISRIQPGRSLNRRTGLWTYCLLTCVTHPLARETVVVLRDIIRKFRVIRSNLNPDAENASQAALPLNLFISIISKVFNNEDLGDYR